MDRAELEREYGKVWDTKELQEDYNVESFLAPLCIVRRKADGAKGTIMFQHMPRFYYSFVSDS